MQIKLENFVDELIGGGLGNESITTIYGPPGSGKSTICFEYICRVLSLGKKVIYVDTEGGFSTERVKLIDANANLKNVVVFSPKDFEQQKSVIYSLTKEVKNSKNFGLIIIDSLVMLYRLRLEGAPQKINSELAEQLRALTEISRNLKIPVLVTNQMYTSFDTKQNKMVGGSLIEYWSKTIIEIEREGDNRKMVLKKHKFRKEGSEVHFEIKDGGLFEVKSRSFSFFRH